MREQLVELSNRDKLPNEVEPLKDIIVSLSQKFLELWDELESLKQRVVVLETENAALKLENKRLNEKIEVLEEENTLLKHKLYGRKSEKSQKKTSNANNNMKQPPEYKEGNRKALPKNLLVERIEYDLKPHEKVCPECQALMTKINELNSRQLELVPLQMKIMELVRLQYECRNCYGHTAIAVAPYKPVEQGLAGPNLLANIIVSKYADHLPLDRQERIFARHGIYLSKSSMWDWIHAVGNNLVPIVEALKSDLITGDHLQCDETPLATLRFTKPKEDDAIESSNKAHKSYMWFYGREAKHGQTAIAIYDFKTGRAGKHAQEFLQDFMGSLLVDGYAGYDNLSVVSKTRQIACKRAGCWAHCRREFENAVIIDRQSIAAEVIEKINKMYQYERQFKEQQLTPPKIIEQRNILSRPITEEIKTWLDTYKNELTPKSRLGKAITYALNQWSRLCYFLEKGEIAIDNNFAERCIKSLVIGRKNYLFAGSPKGGEIAGIFYSLIETCKLNGINPETYLADVMLRVQYHPHAKTKELLPYNWKPPEEEHLDLKQAA